MKEKLAKYSLLSQSRLEKSKTVQMHLADFIQYQTDQATKGKLQESQVQLLNLRLSRILKACKFTYAHDTNGNKIDKWITKMYQTKLSAKSCNHYCKL